MWKALCSKHTSPQGRSGLDRQDQGRKIGMSPSEAMKRQTIGLLTKSLVEVRRSPSWEEMANLAQEHGINLLILVGGMLKSPIDFEAQANILYDLVNASNVDGLIVTGSLGHYIGPEGLQDFCERFRPLPLVSLEVLLNGFPSIIPDFYAGMRALMKHLVEDHGHRRIAFIRGASDSKTGEDRYHAYLDSLSDCGLPIDLNLVAPGTFFPPSGADAVRLLLDERQTSFDALVAANDDMAIDAMQALQARGIRVPEDVAITGFDNLEIAHSVVPQLTTVELPSHKEVHLAAEMLLSLLRGESVQDRIDIQMEVVLRQSCGCQSAAMAQVEVPISPAVEREQAYDWSYPLAEHRQAILAEMVKACCPSPSQAEINLVVELWDAFTHDLRGTGEDRFIPSLKKLTRLPSSAGIDPSAWQGVLSAHRRHTHPILNNYEVIQLAENLWQRGRVFLAETALNLEAQQQFQNSQLDATLHSVGESLITTFDIAGLMDTVARELPRLHIPACYIALYSGKDPLQDHSRLILAYNEKGRMSLSPEGLLFNTDEILPADVLPKGRHSSHLIFSLHFHEDRLGFVVFEVGPRNGIIYETLSLQLSSALKGALLVQEMQRRATELARYNLQLETSLEINRQIGSLLNRQEVIKTFAELIQNSYRFEHVQFFRWVESGQSLQLEEALTGGGLTQISPIKDAVLYKALDRFEPVFVTDPPRTEPQTRTRILLSIRVGNKILGVLDLHSQGITHLTRQEQSGLQSIANQFGITIRNVDLYNEALQARETALQAKALAEKADQLKTRLLANVTHELRTPLNVIIGYSRMALIDPNPYQLELPASLRKDLENIHSSGEHLVRLINDLLDLSRAEIGELDLFPELLAPRPFLEQAFHAMADSVRPIPGVSWKLDLPSRLPVIQADPTRLRQIVLNLLSNAYKFTEAGEIVLGAEVSPPHLHLWVKDTGHGIPIDRQEHIFEPFFTEGYTNRRPEGIGLGLTITRRLVALHGGSLSLESQPGLGSIFHVYLPLPNLSGRVLQSPPLQTAEIHPALLLISSLETPPAEVVDLAKRSEWELYRISSQAHLSTALSQTHPVALVWDLAHSRPGDWAIIQQIRSHPQLSQIPFILFRKEVAGDEAPSARMMNVLIKPFSGQTLADLIQSLQPTSAGGPVLIVDDDPQAREVYSRLISEKLPGFPVAMAEDGSAALEWLERETPSLMILDLSMPNVDGFTVLEHLRANPRTHMTPVFVLTGRLLSYEDIQRLDYSQVIVHFKQVLTEEETVANIQRAFSGADLLPQPTSHLVKQTLAYLQQNFMQTLSRPEIAAAVGVSEDYLSRIFNKEMGLSPWEYLNRYRVLQAKRLLCESKESITWIAGQVGFEDPAYFSRVFQKIAGCSPREFRTQS
jgi:signal transduction histidine kinase/DNA-binding LacI/PurR family transcriptional regulator/AraC-like DNA-binding protein